MSSHTERPFATVLGASQFSRRQFLRASATLGVSAAGLSLLSACASQPAATAAADTLETTTIKVLHVKTSICQSPLYVAEDFLKAEGFTDVQYVSLESGQVPEALSTGQVDFGMQFAGPLITWLDSKQSIVMLGGVHIGCFVLFGHDPVHTILDLKGKTVAILSIGSADHVYLSSMAAYVGLDPTKDIHWMPLPQSDAKQSFIDGTVDAILAFPPLAQELSDKKIGAIVVNSTMDKPWSQYFCCMASANGDWVKRHPVAAKRALRALLEATDSIALHPEQAARYIVDNGYTANYDYALEALRMLPYDRWRDFDPEDTVRFYTLRLHEAGMIKSSPDEIIARGTDWRFLNEIKNEIMPVSFSSLCTDQPSLS